METLQTVYGEFSSGFRQSPLAELCVAGAGIQTGPFGSQLHKRDYVEIGTPIITVEHLLDNRIGRSNLPCVSETDRKRLGKYTLREGDIVFSRVGSVDRRSLVREAEDGWLFSGRCLRVRPDHNRLDPRYLSYFFGMPAFREHIRAIAVGATMPSLNTSLLSEVAVVYPPLVEQRRIAEILGALDDKIELNRRMNETLEQMARALYKSWFVDFDPVRAKMDGWWQRGESLPGMPADLFDLFPDRLVPSELGEIPDGWAFHPLKDIAVIRGSNVSPTAVDPETPYVGLDHIPRRSLALMEWATAGEVTSSKAVFHPGDVLFGKLRPYFHKVVVAPIGGIASTDAVVVKPADADWSAMVVCVLSSEDFVSYTDRTSTGTKMPRTSWPIMGEYEVCLPLQSLAREFNRVTHRLIARISSNVLESRQLASQRDTLLPRLISGDLRAPTECTDAMIEAAV